MKDLLISYWPLFWVIQLILGIYSETHYKQALFQVITPKQLKQDGEEAKEKYGLFAFPVILLHIGSQVPLHSLIMTISYIMYIAVYLGIMWAIGTASIFLWILFFIVYGTITQLVTKFIVRKYFPHKIIDLDLGS